MDMDRVEEAMAAHPREQFLRSGQRHKASYDGPLPIGFGQTNSQPSTVAEMLRLLDVQTGQRVLDVGSGSGWTTALLARLVGPEGQVHGIEIEPSLVRFGRDNLEGTHQPWAKIHSALPELLGLPDQAPFDRILVSASPREMPDQLVDQLAPDGVMVIPVAGVMLRVTNPGAVVTQHGPYRFVPLR